VALAPGLGFITYAGIKILTGRASEAATAVIVLSVAYVVKFAVV
jgi:AGZA family xanthine/uracil permease-like MFS transporter